MTLSECLQCSALFSVGAGSCPQCGGTWHREQGESGEPMQYDDLRKSDLIDICRLSDIAVPSGATKADLIELLEAADVLE